MSTQDYTQRFMVTGHRHVNDEVVYPALFRVKDRAIDKFGIENMIDIAGGAGGADFIHADTAYRSGIALHLEIPHPGYFDRYNPISQVSWDFMLKYAETVHYTVEAGPFDWRYNFRRNEEMLRISNHRIIISNDNPVQMKEDYLNRKIRGGTAACCSKMQKGSLGLWINAQTGEDKWVTF